MPLPLHGFDLFIVLAIALLIFGPKRLPEMGSAVGKTFKEFRKSMSEITESNNSNKTETVPVERQIVATQATTETPTKTETVTEVH